MLTQNDCASHRFYSKDEDYTGGMDMGDFDMDGMMGDEL